MKISKSSLVSKIQQILDNKYLLFLLVFYIFIFWELLTEYIPAFKFFDEAFAMLAIPLWLWNLWKKRKITLDKKNCVIYLGGFLALGVLGSIVYHYQPVTTAVADLIVNTKFWLVIYVGINLFGSLDVEEHGEKLGKHVKLVVLLYVILIIVDHIFDGIFPADIRYGFRSTQLFYGVHTIFCAKCGFLIALLVMVRDKVKYSDIYLAVLLVLMASTMRSKAFGAVAMFMVLFYLVAVKKKKIQIKTFVILAAACVLVGWNQIKYYFFIVTEGGARSVLLKTSIEIANDHFPLGSGFGTFACHYSGVSYSPLYEMYGIENTWGLRKEYPAFISDSFWPMIIAQFGYIGLILFCTVLYLLYRKISELMDVNYKYYLAALFSLGYLCISSMAESAFTNPIAVPYALIIGICLKKKEYEKGR